MTKRIENMILSRFIVPFQTSTTTWKKQPIHIEESTNPCFYIKQSIFQDQPIHVSRSTNPCFRINHSMFQNQPIHVSRSTIPCFKINQRPSLTVLDEMVIVLKRGKLRGEENRFPCLNSIETFPPLEEC